RGPTGTRIEQTEEMALKTLGIVEELAGPGNVESSVGYVGTFPSQYPVQYIYHWTCGPEEVSLRVSLRHGSGVRVADLKERLRADRPGAGGPERRDRPRRRPGAGGGHVK